MPITFKSQILQDYKAQNATIYKKFSPYSGQSSNTLISFGPKQPYIYIYPNDGNKGLNGLKRYENTALPLADGPQDLIRISKFFASSYGASFLLNQTFLQSNQAFTETRIYNPLMPIQAASRAASMFSIPMTKRYIDVSSPLGILGSFTNGLLGGNNFSPVPGTTQNISDDTPGSSKAYSGLIRFPTAQRAKNRFTNIYNSTPVTSNLLASAISQLSGPVAAISNTITGVFSAFSNPTQITVGGNQAVYRSDEDVYSVLISGMPSRMGVNRFGRQINVQKYTNNLSATNLYGVAASKIPGPYENINANSDSPLLQKYDNTDLDIENPKNFNTLEGDNYSEQSRENSISTELQRLLSNIDSYAVDRDYVLGKLTIVSTNREDGIDSAGKYSNYSTPTNGYEKTYAGGDNSDFIDGPFKGFQSNGNPDQINILTVLSGSQFTEGSDYDPYTDDQIAFYFHDLVNDRYIPFRATTKGISEQNTAEWDAITYIGRADKLYNYKGFTRQLNFSFVVVASSIKELLPMWTRINYIMSAVKPGGYKDLQYNTNGSNLQYTSKFVIPPLMSITIGDLYKEQPVVMNTITLTIPDDSLWETWSEEYASNNLYEYFNNRIIWEDSYDKFAQFPRECEISIGGNLLEQDFPEIGKHNFGGFDSAPNSFSKQLIVGSTSTPNGTVTVGPLKTMGY